MDQGLAHIDIEAPPPQFTMEAYEALVEDAESVIGDLYGYYHFRTYSRASIEQLAISHWSEIRNLIDQ